MKILVVGNGGREHALVWKLARSPLVTDVFCAPGNAGTALDGQNLDINANDVARLIKFSKTEQIDLTVIGPEAPLVAGMVDAFEDAEPARLRSDPRGRRIGREQGLRQGHHAPGKRPDGRLCRL